MREGEVCIRRDARIVPILAYSVKLICKDKEGFAIMLWHKRFGTSVHCTKYAVDMQYCVLVGGQFYFHVFPLSGTVTHVSMNNFKKKYQYINKILSTFSPLIWVILVGTFWSWQTSKYEMRTRNYASL
jgi:hypothetical protein